MQESRKQILEKQRQYIVYLHDKLDYSFKEIGEMPEFSVTPAAIFKRYKKQTIRNKDDRKFVFSEAHKNEPKLGG